MSIHDDADRIREQIDGINSTRVRLALFGQPGAGKSSLINRLVGRQLAPTGTKNDITRAEQPYDWNGLHLVDLPGYGTPLFPADTYFEKFDIMSFDFFLCVFAGSRLTENDVSFFKRLKDEGKQILFVCNQRDSLWSDDGTPIELIEKEIEDNLKEQISSETIKLFFTSCRNKHGIGELSKQIWILLGNINERKQEVWARSAKAYSKDFLEEKRRACEKLVALYAALSAANTLNPIPGLDISVDLGILIALFKSVRDNYGLTDESLELAKNLFGPAAAQFINNIIGFATKDGLIQLLKRFAGRAITKEFAKWIPIVGQLISGGLAFGITMTAGTSYLNDCHSLAEKILERELDTPK